MSAPSPSRARRRRRLILAVGALALIAVVVIGVVLLTKGGGSPSPPRARETGPSPTPRGPPPRAKLEVELLPSVPSTHLGRHAPHLSTREAAKRSRTRRERTRAAARKVRATMERLYTAGLMNPGRPASRWLRVFTGGARKEAWRARNLVTIGATGRGLRNLHERQGDLRIRVLLDRHNHPLTAFAAVKFRAVGPLRSGGRLVVVSRGRFFLRSGGHGWVVYAFQVERNDRKRGA